MIIDGFIFDEREEINSLIQVMQCFVEKTNIILSVIEISS
jgi:hypothetical protein